MLLHFLCISCPLPNKTRMKLVDWLQSFNNVCFGNIYEKKNKKKHSLPSSSLRGFPALKMENGEKGKFQPKQSLIQQRPTLPRRKLSEGLHRIHKDIFQGLLSWDRQTTFFFVIISFCWCKMLTPNQDRKIEYRYNFNGWNVVKEAMSEYWTRQIFFGGLGEGRSLCISW